ncbi:MAG: hypothetical protein JW873_05735 [Candidatus Saganbacteria bacterium]|nr:hypothetical protein [Candidatus Saganbacteria bacterium]
MNLDVSPFKSIRAGKLELQRWHKMSRPVVLEGANPLGVVVNFAKHMGLRSLSARTIKKFRNDPYYSICFYVLRSPNYVYHDEQAGAHQRRLVHLLRHPDDYNDRDLCEGFRNYLNNFHSYLPGGYRRVDFQSGSELYADRRDIFEAIDKILADDTLVEGGPGKALELQGQLRASGDRLAAQAAYHKYCFDIFNMLVKQGFDPRRLWG